MASLWADLPADLLSVILSKLFGIDRCSFGLVCRHWKTVTLVCLHGKTVTETWPDCCFSPCLVNYGYNSNRHHTWKMYQNKSLFIMSFHEFEKSTIHCSMYGWLLMTRWSDKTLFFFNPANYQKIELPCGIVVEVYKYATLWFLHPPTSMECVVVGIQSLWYKQSVRISTLKRGENEWKIKKYTNSTNKTKPFSVWRGVPTFHRGLMYFLGLSGDIATFDIQQGRLDVNFRCLTPQKPSDVIDEEYLVKVNGEDALYAVYVFGSKRNVKVFKLSCSEMKWDLVESIGDKVFYLSNQSTFGYKAPTKNMENTICFPILHGDVPVFYSLSDAKYHCLDGDYSEINAWDFRKLSHAPWIMPMPILAQYISPS